MYRVQHRRCVRIPRRHARAAASNRRAPYVTRSYRHKIQLYQRHPGQFVVFNVLCTGPYELCTTSEVRIFYYRWHPRPSVCNRNVWFPGKLKQELLTRLQFDSTSTESHGLYRVFTAVFWAHQNRTKTKFQTIIALASVPQQHKRRNSWSMHTDVKYLW